MARSPYFRNPTYTDFKESVRVASTASVNLNLPGSSIDGIVLTFGDTVLLKDQGIPADNGIYVWRAPNLPMQRASGGIDHQISSGMLVPVEEGVVNADKIFMLTTDEPIETGETALVFEELIAAMGGNFDPAVSQNITAPWTFTDTLTTSDINMGGSTFDTQGGNILTSGGHIFTSGILHIDSGRLEATDSALVLAQTGDTEPKLAINENGIVEWSDGTNPPDVSLSRYGSGVLEVDNNFRVGGNIAVANGVSMLGNTALTGVQASSATSEFLRAGLGSDATDRFVADHNGKLSWGDGSTAPDTNLFRDGAGVLRTNDALRVDNFLRVDGSSGIIRVASSGGETAFNAQVSGDTNARLIINSSGVMAWGDGVNPNDTNLYRLSSGVLKTDDSLVVGGSALLGDTPADLIGLYGTPPVAQAAAIVAPATQTASYVQADVQSIADAVNDIIAALAGIGITA